MSTIDFIEQYIDLKKVGGYDEICKAISALGIEKARMFCLEAIEHFSGKSKTVGGRYSYIADTKLSGLPVYCSGLSCRMRDVYDVAGYTVLYGDQTTLVDPFSFAMMFAGGKAKDKKYIRFREELAFAVFQVLTLRPLIESGLIAFVRFTSERFCQKCLAKVIMSEEDADTIIVPAFEYLFETSKCYVEHRPGEKVVRIEYDENHNVGHPVIVSAVNQSWLNKLPEGHLIDREALALHSIFFEQSHMLTHDFFAKNFLADEAGAQSVFSNEFEFASVSRFASSAVHRKELTLDYPLLTAVRLADAVSIRDAEWHHIHDFRTAFSKILDEHAGASHEVDSVVQNEVSNLYKILEKARRQAKGEMIDAVPMAAFSIIATVATSGLSSLVSAAAGVLGGGHAASKAIPALRKSITIPEEARANRFYFAWRVGRVLAGH